MMKQVWLVVISLLLAALPAVAQEDNATIVLQVIPVSPEVEVGGTAVFKLAVTNVGDERDIFKVSGDPSDVSPFSNAVQYIQVEPNQIRLDPHEMKEAEITIKVLESAKSDDEFVADVHVASLAHVGMRKSTSLKVFVVAKKEVVQISVNAPTNVIPGDLYSFTVLLKNRLNLPLENHEVSVYSDLPGISESIILNFTPREERELEFSFPISLNSLPGAYALNVKVYDDSELKGGFTSAFSVQEKSAIEEQKAEKGGFLKSVTRVTRTNKGNVKSTQKIIVKSNFLNTVFTSTQPEAQIERGDFVWEFSLEPGEAYTVTIESNYRSLFYGFLIIVLAIILIYFYIERSVVIKKRIFMVKSSPDGISEIKILLIIRNGSKHHLQNVKAYDVLPNLIQPLYEFGTLKPHHVQQGTRGKRFVWEIGALEPGEERVLTYRVKAKLHLAGGALLPPAMLQYQKGDNLVHITSHKLDIAPQRAEETAL